MILPDPASGGGGRRGGTVPNAKAWTVYKRLLGYAWAHKLRLAVAFLFAVVVATSFTSIILSLAMAVNVLFGDMESVTAGITNRVNEIPAFMLAPFDADRTRLAEWAVDWVARVRVTDDAKLQALGIVCAVVVLLTIVAAGARFLQEYFAGSVGNLVSVQLGREMFRNVMGLSLGFFERRTTGEILARFTNDVFMVNRGLSNVFVKLMREPVNVLFFLGLALVIDPVLTLVGLCVLPAVGYVIVKVGERFRRSVRRSLEKVATVAGVANETFAGIAIVKSFCMESYEIERTDKEFDKLRRHLLKMVKIDAMVGPLVEIVLVVGLVAFVLFAGQRVVGGTLPPAKLTALTLALASMLGPVRKLTSVNNLIQSSVASAQRVFEFIDEQPEVVEAPDAVEVERLRDAWRFENVCFSYDGEHEVLSNINLEVRRGETVALVGFSGSGKSTLVKLLPRFYDVTSGRITLDGVDIRRATFSSLRGQIGIVTQDTVLFNEPVRANIAFGRGEYSDERVREAARAAHADGFIEKLPHGYDTVLGESGGNLSGGQRQRLAIARAIIKDPELLILDEATSSLDSQSEQAIQEAVQEFVKGRTAIVIAHRLSTVQRADRLVVLHEGRIAEMGTHAELLAQGGRYSQLYETQFLPGQGDGS